MLMVYASIAMVILSLIVKFLHLGGEVGLFFIAAIAVIPLAGVMGKATEEIAAVKGPAIGGLMNATLGNATELIIAVMALSEGYTEIVKSIYNRFHNRKSSSGSGGKPSCRRRKI